MFFFAQHFCSVDANSFTVKTVSAWPFDTF